MEKKRNPGLRVCTGNIGQTGPKLGGKKQKYRIEICKMLALGYSPTLVAQEMRDNFNIIISAEAIRKAYLKNPKRWHTINALRDRMADEVMAHPLANKKVRLAYLLRALNHALVYATDRLYFDKDGNEVGRLMKVQLGVVAQLVKEAREEIEGPRKDEGVEGKKKLDLLQVIRILSNDKGSATIIKNRIGESQAETAGMDQRGIGNYEIL